MSKKLDLTDERFGRLLVLKRAENYITPQGKQYSRWLVECDCGKFSVVHGVSLRSGHTQSCGCLLKERITKHGMHGTPAYDSWHNMLQRCNNPNATKYYNYGGRGITVCKRWLKFKNFFEDMGEKPEGLTIDRYPDNNGNYEPGNCRWATRAEQEYNKRVSSRNTTGVVGVVIRQRKKHNKYQAWIQINKQGINLGLFDTLEQATAARKQAEQQYWR